MAKRSARRTSGAESARLNAKEQRELEKAEAARSKRNQTILMAFGGLALVAVIIFVAARSAAAPAPGRFVPSLGNAHPWQVPPEPPYDGYNSVPPTSGPHMGYLAPWGVHDEPIRNEIQIHNLEDGGVNIQYNCPEGCPELVAQLAAIAARYEDKVVVAPYPDMDTRIALTAWTRIDQFEEFDEQRIVRFINAYRGIDHHGPRGL